MTRHERRRTLPADGPPRTTPSEAVGESGDVAARREAEKATRGRTPDDEGGMTAKRQSPGLGREEQRRPLGRRGEAETEEDQGLSGGSGSDRP